jgi:hypothetical protein
MFVILRAALDIFLLGMIDKRADQAIWPFDCMLGFQEPLGLHVLNEVCPTSETRRLFVERIRRTTKLDSARIQVLMIKRSRNAS